MDTNGIKLTPKDIVSKLNEYIVGQNDAKRKVAIALRNRYRRSLLKEEEKQEIAPKNILMIGPTGVGKTEIARRMAKIVGAPFIKVEATKFTEVGYVGRDVESMVRDLVDVAVRLVKDEKKSLVKDEATKKANDKLVKLLVPSLKRRQHKVTTLWKIYSVEQFQTSVKIKMKRKNRQLKKLKPNVLK